MLESLRQKIADLQGKVQEYERLAGRLVELEQVLRAEAPRLAQLKDQLARQYREATERDRAVQAAAAGQPRDRKMRIEQYVTTIEHIKLDKVREALALAEKEAADLQARLARLQEAKAGLPPAAQAPHRAADIAPARPAPPAAPPAAAAFRAPPAIAVAREAAAVASPAARPAPAPAAAAVPEHPVAETAGHPGGPAANEAETAAPAPLAAAAAEHVAAETGAEAPQAAAPAAEEGGESGAHEQALREAVETGRQAMASVDRCFQSLQAVARGGVWHAVGSAVFSKSPDHAKLHGARSAAGEAEENLARFRRQVADLRRRFGGKFEIGEVPALADAALDALPEPAKDEVGLRRHLGAIHETYHEVRALCARLQLDANHLRARAAALERLRHRTARSA